MGNSDSRPEHEATSADTSSSSSVKKEIALKVMRVSLLHMGK